MKREGGGEKVKFQKQQKKKQNDILKTKMWGGEERKNNTHTDCTTKLNMLQLKRKKTLAVKHK